jgi:hypothetical protein
MPSTSPFQHQEMGILLHHAQECLIMIRGFDACIVGEFLENTVIIVHRRLSLIRQGEELIQHLKCCACPQMLVGRRKPPGTQQLLFQWTSPQSQLAVACVDRNTVNPVGVEDGEAFV